MSTSVEAIMDYVERTEQDAQLAGTLMDNRPERSPGRPPYFYLRDLVNPQQAYWAHIGQEPEHTDELRRLFARGNRMERLAHQAFELLDDFTGIEAILDGAENDIAGVRGRIDFRYGDSLVEFKTTEYHIENSSDIWNYTPQDIEQLLFYSGLWTHDNPEHYLIYYLVDVPQPIRVFKVSINDHGMIQNQLESRKTNLERALEIEDPSLARRCRYHGETCHIDAAGLCNCPNHDEINTEPLERVTDINRQDDLEEMASEAFAELDERLDPVRPWDLETPRRWFGRQARERDRGQWTPDDMWVYDAMHNADLLPGPMESEYIPKLDEPIPFAPKGRIIEITRTTANGFDTQWVPALAWVKDYTSPPKSTQLQNQIMQVGCSCALYGSTSGYCIIELPEADADVVAYRVFFEDIDGLEDEIREMLQSMRQAIEEDDPGFLPTCPEWLQDMSCDDCLCE